MEHDLIDTLLQLGDLLLHIDRHLDVVIQQYGYWAYGLLFAIVFAETGLVVAPFLPGDSLLFQSLDALYWIINRGDCWQYRELLYWPLDWRKNF
jgi:hypothetical protein